MSSRGLGRSQGGSSEAQHAGQASQNRRPCLDQLLHRREVSASSRRSMGSSHVCRISVTRLVFTVPTILMLACRAMEFVASLLRRLEADKDVTLSTAASDAYAETLHRFHGWITSAAFYVALKVRQA